MSRWQRFLLNTVYIRPVVLGSTAVLGTYCLARLDDGDYDTDTQERIVGGYNNRIRQFSSPEKIFRTFASHKGENGQMLMDWRDFRTAFLPYTFQAKDIRSREVKVDLFLKKFASTMIHSKETNGTGSAHTDELINFAEYSYINALASIPKHRFHLALKMFDVDGNGFITDDELEKVIELFKPTSMTANSFRKVIQGTVAYHEMVGSDGKVSIEEMYSFMCKLRECILKMEFDQYDHEGKGSISSRDFAMSLVAHSHHKHVHNYLKQVKTCPDHGRITLSEFLEFNEALWQLNEIVEGLAFYFKADTNITSEVLQRAFYAGSGIMLPIKMMIILRHIADKDKDGILSLEELSTIMAKRQVMNLTESRESGLFRVASCMWSCCR